jgi:transaldolase
VVVKCPLTREGIKATAPLSAAKAGAYIVTPFVGRLDDTGFTGMDLIRSITQIYQN